MNALQKCCGNYTARTRRRTGVFSTWFIKPIKEKSHLNYKKFFMPTIKALYIYPIKSLGGIQLNTSNITRRGLENDRSWMLVDDNNQFLTQRTFPEMALLKTGIEKDNILVHHLQDPSDFIKVPLHPSTGSVVSVKVWDDYCEAQIADENINDWFSAKLGVSCKAVYMMDNFERKLDPRYAIDDNNVTGFSDGYPILMVS
ncbi:MAG: MOSC domain-containing protein, partial [Sphingobacteriales bacterium]